MDNLTPKFSSGSHVSEHANRLYRESCDNWEIFKLTKVNTICSLVAAIASTIAVIISIIQIFL